VYTRKIIPVRANRDGRLIGVFDPLGKLQPLPRELLVLPPTFLAPEACELLAFCGVGAEFLTDLHVEFSPKPTKFHGGG
jgi:hypothetical protein